MRKSKSTYPVFLSWENPDIDAETYLLDIIRRISNDPPEFDIHDAIDFKKQYISENPDLYVIDPEIGRLTTNEREDRIDRIATDLAFAEAPGQLQEWDDYNGDPKEDVDFPEIDILSSEYRDLVDRTEHAIETRDQLDILDSLNELIDVSGKSVNIPVLENWVRLLTSNEVVASNQADECELPVLKEIIRVLNDFSERLCELIAKDPRVLKKIEWRELEKVVATAFRGIGMRVRVTPPSKDGGKDVVVQFELDGKRHVYFIEVKHWRSGKTVGERSVFDFLDINMQSKSNGGLFLSTSGYSPSVYRRLSEMKSQNLYIGDQRKIVRICQRFVQYKSGLWRPSDPYPSILTEACVNNNIFPESFGDR